MFISHERALCPSTTTRRTGCRCLCVCSSFRNEISRIRHVSRKRAKARFLCLYLDALHQMQVRLILLFARILENRPSKRAPWSSTSARCTKCR